MERFIVMAAKIRKHVDNVLTFLKIFFLYLHCVSAFFSYNQNYSNALHFKKMCMSLIGGSPVKSIENYKVPVIFLIAAIQKFTFAKNLRHN